MKKWKILTLSALCISCFALATACKEKEEPTNTNELVGFVDETVEIELGDIISVHDFLKVYDEAGNLYNATFLLTDSAGNSVSLLKNEFTVEDSVGYTLVLSAHDPQTGEVIATRTLQLKTVDKSAPLISLLDMEEYGVVGEAFSVPLMFDDASENYTTSVTVLRVPYRVALNDYDESAAQEVSVEYVSKGDKATFTPTMKGRHKVIVEAWDGTDKEAAKTATLLNEKTFYIDVRSTAGEIEGFDLPSSTKAAYGYNTEKATGDKETPGNSVEWHETFNGKEGVVSMKPATTDSDGGIYYLTSMDKSTSFYGSFGTDATKNTLWDYVSVWIWIAGNDGETVEVSGRYGFNAQQVPCNTWYEYRQYLDYFVRMGWGSIWRTFSNELRYYTSGANKGQRYYSDDNRSILYVGSDATADYTVYVDSFAYVKTDDAMDISVSDAGSGTASIVVTPKDGYDFTNATYTYFARALAGTASAKTLTVTDGTFTYDAEKWTKYWVCARVEVNGKTYFKHFIYELPTATA